jgi:hypothetical protein
MIAAFALFARQNAVKGSYGDISANKDSGASESRLKPTI